MKIHLYWIILICLTFLVSAIECQRVTNSDDIPCTLISSHEPTTGCNENINIYSNSGELLQVLEWGDSIPYCNSSFNISTVGTYIYNSTIEDGVIVIEKDDNMLTIIIVQLFIISFFILIGIPHKVGFVKIVSWGLGVIEFLMTIWMVYIVESGGEILIFLYVNAISILIVGGTLGFITLFSVMVKLMNVSDEKGIEDDSYTKWLQK